MLFLWWTVSLDPGSLSEVKEDSCLLVTHPTVLGLGTAPAPAPALATAYRHGEFTLFLAIGLTYNCWATGMHIIPIAVFLIAVFLFKISSIFFFSSYLWNGYLFWGSLNSSQFGNASLVVGRTPLNQFFTYLKGCHMSLLSFSNHEVTIILSILPSQLKFPDSWSFPLLTLNSAPAGPRCSRWAQRRVGSLVLHLFPLCSTVTMRPISQILALNSATHPSSVFVHLMSAGYFA